MDAVHQLYTAKSQYNMVLYVLVSRHPMVGPSGWDMERLLGVHIWTMCAIFSGYARVTIFMYLFALYQYSAVQVKIR